MINPIEQIVKHIEELDKDLVSTIPGNPFEQWQVYTALMQAKSTALLALVQAEANAMSRQPLKYAVKVEREGYKTVMHEGETVIPAWQAKELACSAENTGPSGG
jgi:hypothetical protein